MKEMQQRVASWFAQGVTEDEIFRRLAEQPVNDEFGLLAFLTLNHRPMRLKAADAVVCLPRQG